MAGKKARGLGRGLDILLSTIQKETAVTAEDSLSTQAINIRKMPVESLQRGKYQPRRDIQPDALQELANSIKSQGILQPLVVRSIGANKYEIIAGERRWRAAQLIGLAEVPAIIRDVPDEAAMAMSLIENIQRENLNPLEEAIALQRLLEEFQLTHQQISEAVGKSRTTITNTLRLTHLEPQVQLMLQAEELEVGHAKVILALHGAEQLKAAHIIASKKLSVRETERLVKQLQHPTSPKNERKTPNPNIKHLEQKLCEQLGAMVEIKHTHTGKGKLIIQYTNLEQLDGILQHIK